MINNVLNWIEMKEKFSITRPPIESFKNRKHKIEIRSRILDDIGPVYEDGRQINFLAAWTLQI